MKAMRRTKGSKRSFRVYMIVLLVALVEETRLESKVGILPLRALSGGRWRDLRKSPQRSAH